MKPYLEKLAIDHENALETLCKPEVEKQLHKIQGSLMPGARCAWCYEDDVEYWKKYCDGEYRHPKDWPYTGLLVPFPETCGRNEMEAENVLVVVTEYPIEKENPTTDWTTLAKLLEGPGLHRFYVFEEIKLQSQP